MSQRNRQAQTARQAARPGLRQPHPWRALGWILASLLWAGGAVGQEAPAGPNSSPPAESPPESPPSPMADPASESTPESAQESESAPGAASEAPADLAAEPGPDLDPLAGTGYVSPYNPVNDYLDAIDRIEMDYGPYASELSDLYLGLGQTLLSSGEYERARDAFYRGVQGVRVNLGPNSPEQTNHLYLIANIEVVLGDFRKAEEALENIYFVNSSHYGEDSAEMLPVLERIYQWHSMMRPVDSPGTDYRDFARRLELAQELVRVSEIVHGMGHPETSRAYRRLGEAHFRTLLHIMDETVWLSAEEYVAISSANINMSGPGSSWFGEHFDKGRKVYRKYLKSLAANESTTALEYAEALAGFADWYLLFEKARRAHDLYEQAYEALSQSEEYADQADAFMATPRPVQFMSPQPGLPEDLPDELHNLEIGISMTVTSFGGVRDVEIVNLPEGLTKDHQGAIRKWLRETPFRPAMKESEIVTTKDFIWHFTLAPDDPVPESIAPEGQAS